MPFGNKNLMVDFDIYLACGFDFLDILAIRSLIKVSVSALDILMVILELSIIN